MAEEVQTLETEQEGDPADFLLSNPKYHDCHVTVGFPDTEDVEKVGVSSTHLIAHSPVFRDMLSDSQLADPTGANTHIKDVSPATFKLMLRHVYGGKLPEMTAEEAAELALCADKYNIQRLVGKAAKRLKPTNAEDVFPALMCAAYINCPDLELQVSQIIQQQTDKICQNLKFLKLDENCLLFVVKQSTLNINELQLWNNIVRWGEYQVKTRPGKTLRDCLNKILKHLRLLSLTSNEIVDHVLPKKVLTPHEFIDLTLAVSNNQTLQSPGLCKEQIKRGVYMQEAKQCDNYYKPKTTHTYCKCSSSQRECRLANKEFSSFKIMPKVSVEINTLTVASIQSPPPKNDPSFKTFALTCSITIYKTSKGHLVQTETLMLKSLAVVPNGNIVIQVKKSDNKPLILEAGENYYWKMQMDPPLPVHRCEVYYGGGGTTDITTQSVTNNHFTITYEDFYHILGFEYSV